MNLKSHSWAYIQRTGPKRSMQPSADRSTVYNSQDMEASYKSTGRGMDKDGVSHMPWNVTQPLNRDVRLFAATRIDLESVRLSEVSQRRVSIICHLLYVESEKK